MADTAPTQSYSAHVLPGYFEQIQKWLVLPLLLICEFYVMGLFSARGFVNNLADPGSWSWYGSVGVAVSFFGVGLACAGIALGLSGNCAEAFARGRMIRGLFLGAGVAFFAGVELYAGISERSVNLISTPADTALGQFIGLALKAATPASIIASILLPLATIFYGFALKPPQIEAAEVRKERMQREQEEAEHKLKLAAIKGRSLGARFGGMAAAAKEQISSEKPVDDTSTNEYSFSPETDDDSGGKLLTLVGKKQGGRRGNGRSLAALPSIPRGHWMRDQLIDYVRRTYGQDLPPQKAAQIVSTRAGSLQHKQGFAGSPYSAPSAQLIAWARANYGQETEQVQQA